MFSHGWPLSSDSWESLMLFLAEHGYRIIAHDRRGHSSSSQAGHGREMNSYADDLVQLIDHLGQRDPPSSASR
jgi:non-heme chloroperoxidase